MAQNKKTATRKGAAKEILRRQYGNGTAIQRSRVLEFLRRHGSLSTLDARHLLDCLHPAARVMELRRAGYEISTIWSHETTPEGGVHRVARYCLMRKAAAC